MKLSTVIKIGLFFIAIWLVYFGRLVRGAQGLAVQAVGIVILLSLLYLYNERYV